MCSVEAEGQDHRSYSLLENHLHVLSHPNIRTCSLNNLSSWIFFSPVCIRCTFLYLLTTFFLYRSYPDGDLKPQCNVSWLCCPFSMEQHHLGVTFCSLPISFTEWPVFQIDSTVLWCHASESSLKAFIHSACAKLTRKTWSKTSRQKRQWTLVKSKITFISGH